MNPEDDFLLVMTESQAKRLFIRAIDTYINSRSTSGRAKQEIAEQIVTDCILDSTYAGEIQ
jgi:hypothetical protein